MTVAERQLAFVAGKLLGTRAGLTTPERQLLASALPVSNEDVSKFRKQIVAGYDPLGDQFCAVRSAADRRDHGAIYTPAEIVHAMVDWAQSEIKSPKRIVDAGAGSGRFLFRAAERFPNAELIAVELDPLAALMLRANAAIRKFSDRLTVHVSDYRSLELPSINAPTLFIGNPPYVRHHEISERWKTWFASTAERFGFSASKLAGLHIHFFLKTRELAAPGDIGAFITAAEWLDVNYGSVLRKMLADGLGGTAVHVINPQAQLFTDTLTTGAITCFRVGNRPDQITMRSVHSLDELSPLSKGDAISWDDASESERWSELLRPKRNRPSSFIELGELFRVHRGQVTGNNAVWIAEEHASEIPARFKRPAVTRARELFLAGPELVSSSGLKRVIDLPTDLDSLDRKELEAVQHFLAWARRHDAHKSYVAQHRRAWWSVALRKPAPILCTYMARQAPAFVRNRAKAHHINIAHGLYPREDLSDATIDGYLTYLRLNTTMAGGRVYSGGLVKFEPKELERILVPRLQDLHGYIADSVESRPTAKGRSGGASHISRRSNQRATRSLQSIFQILYRSIWPARGQDAKADSKSGRS